MKLLGRLICWRKGHRRGRSVKGTELLKCPRCEAVWTRKKRKVL